MRYAVLKHERQGEAHFDILLAEPQGGLRTFSVTHFPLGPGWRPVRPLPSHREVYLSYQGPVYPGNGYVRRWDDGNYRLCRDDATGLVAHLDGRRHCGRLELRVTKGDDWELEFTPFG